MKHILGTFVALFLLLFVVSPAFAIENPLAASNNRAGIHILFPTELDKAAALVNSNGGDWGYVVIPIQSGDKDLQKWQSFMDDCQKLHVIPIIRLATEGDYFNTKVWRVPTDADVLDFANFLNSLSWPTKNRYIIVYNEVNRGDEWGGTPDPAAYAQLLSYAVDVFKQRNPNFFIISSGMDNGAATTNESINEYTYFSDMISSVSDIFNKVDGIASHSYPNPAFSQPPSYIARTSATSYQFERNLIEGHSSKDLPVFITETGWDQSLIGQQKAADYLSSAMQTIWTNSNIVTVAPFLLQAGSGPFEQFSFFAPNGDENAVYAAYKDVPKTKGKPALNPPVKTTVLAAKTGSGLPSENFPNAQTHSQFSSYFAADIKTLFKWFLHVQ